MKRTNISKLIDAESVFMEFNEEYQSGLKVATTSHFLDDFTVSDSGVKHRAVSDEDHESDWHQPHL